MKIALDLFPILLFFAAYKFGTIYEATAVLMVATLVQSLLMYRLDGKLQQISIGTNQASINITHLFRLFELRISKIRPDLGIELFVLEATNVEELTQEQKAIWHEEEEASLNEINELLYFISIRNLHPEFINEIKNISSTISF